MNDKLLGRIEAFLSAGFLAFIFYFVKSSTHDAQQMSYLRGALNIPILVVQVIITKEDLFGDWEKVNKCCTRGEWSSKFRVTSAVHRIHDGEY